MFPASVWKCQTLQVPTHNILWGENCYVFLILVSFNEIKLFIRIFIGYFVGLRSLENVLVQYDFGKIRNHFVF